MQWTQFYLFEVYMLQVLVISVQTQANSINPKKNFDKEKLKFLSLWLPAI